MIELHLSHRCDRVDQTNIEVKVFGNLSKWKRVVWIQEWYKIYTLPNTKIIKVSPHPMQSKIFKQFPYSFSTLPIFLMMRNVWNSLLVITFLYMGGCGAAFLTRLWCTFYKVLLWIYPCVFTLFFSLGRSQLIKY